MAKINHNIPPQNFELVRNRILDILIDELGNQYIYTYDPDFNALNFKLEFYNAIDKTEVTTIVVSLVNGQYGERKDYRGSIAATYQYAVDIYTNAKTNPQNPGITISTVKLHKFLGICRCILEDPQYKTLGYVPGFIARVWVSELQIAQPKQEQGLKDALNTMMGRLTFNVALTETADLIKPTLATGYDTKVKIENTLLGYQYTTNNYF